MVITWQDETNAYADAVRERPAWAYSGPLGLCPMVCPDHRRHCDNNDGHDGTHACSLCQNRTPR
jgi:hypothetical protein